MTQRQRRLQAVQFFPRLACTDTHRTPSSGSAVNVVCYELCSAKEKAIHINGEPWLVVKTDQVVSLVKTLSSFADAAGAIHIEKGSHRATPTNMLARCTYLLSFSIHAIIGFQMHSTRVIWAWARTLAAESRAPESGKRKLPGREYAV